MTLKNLLEERTDFDMAMYHLACCLGTLNSKNDISDFLYEMLEGMVKFNILQVNDDGYLWNDKR